MRVTHAMYRSCNNSNPISTFTTGNDSVTLTNHGHHFFLCGVPGHCVAGQKLELNVTHPVSFTPLSDPPISSSLSPPSTTTIPAAGVPGPSPNHAASLPSAAAAVVPLLEKSFETENKLEPERKTQLAKMLGLQPRQVSVWFQNRRARWKTKQLERDFNLLKSSYDQLLSNYDSILKDNHLLRSY
ncbi:Uncharacterized protein Rs2_15783 [Raphanus sativus]|nr:Uncharacterized protein Rs2_15783 [Raphanus sativus]